MFGSDLLALPVHSGASGVVDLHAIATDIALAGIGIASNHAWQCDEPSSIFRPALEDGKIQQREIVTFDNLFARSGGNRFRKEFSHLCEHGEHFHFVEEALRGL